MTVPQTVFDRKGGRRGQVGHEFDRTDSGHEVSDLDGGCGGFRRRGAEF